MSQIIIFTLVTVHLVTLHTIQLFTFLTATYDTYRFLTLLVYVIIRFRVQFGINLHEWVFQKAELARAASASEISAFWDHKWKLISNWKREPYDYLSTILTLKNARGKSAGRCFLKPFFAFRVSIQNFCHCFTWDLWSTKFLIIFLQINIHNYDM